MTDTDHPSEDPSTLPHLPLEEKSWRFQRHIPSSSSEAEAELRQSFRPRSNADLTEVALIRRATPLVDAFAGRLPLAREITDINEHFGVEIAQTVFTQALERLPMYGGFIRRVRAFDPRQIESVRERARQFEVTLVRSSLPVRDIEWGAFVEKWRGWARALGFTTDVIDTLETNDLRQNARVISNHLFSHPHPRRILVTYGQGAAEVRTLFASRLGLRGENATNPEAVGELGSIHAWLNVAGAFNGAGSARLENESWFSSVVVGLSRYFGRHMIQARARRLRQLDPRLPAWQSLPNFPAGLQVINVIGQPLRSEMPVNLLVSYDRLSRQWGPNDGAVGVFESIAHPGLIVPVPGMTHNIQSPKFEPIFKRLLAIIATDAQIADQKESAHLELDL